VIILERLLIISDRRTKFGWLSAPLLDDFPQHLETQIISKPIEMTHFRQLPSLSQQFLEPPENNSGSFALVKI